MGIHGYKWTAIVAAVVCVGLSVLCGYLFLSLTDLRIRVAFASDQVEVIEAMQKRALNASVGSAANDLEYAVRYYPSGTKQEVGSPLDRVVEFARGMAVKDIISYLRRETGDELGEDPEPWIRKYGRS